MAFFEKKKIKAFWEEPASANHAAAPACIWFMCHHLTLDDVNIQVLLPLHDIFHSLCTQTHDNVRLTTSKDSVWHFRVVLERYPTTHRKYIISLYDCSASSHSGAHYEKCTVHGATSGVMRRFVQTPETHTLCLISFQSEHNHLLSAA